MPAIAVSADHTVEANISFHKSIGKAEVEDLQPNTILHVRALP